MDPFSRAAAVEIFAAFPEWRSLAREERAEDGSSYLVIEVAPPGEADVEHGLVVDTSNQEITVGFDFYHDHFDQRAGGREHLEAAMEFVRQILAERVAVVSYWLGEEWRGSSQLEAGAAHETPSWIERFDRVRIRSWKGSLNTDIRR